ncbi:MAG: hypothetical protein AB3N33_11955 [Puniceicoccaceae bacterium]
MSNQDLQTYHRKFAVTAFNDCWKLIDLPQRTPEETRAMIRLAEVSYWHWMAFKEHTAENEGIGLWQLSRVYALAGQPGTSLTYALEYAELTRQAQLGAFHEGYAWEAQARACMVAGDAVAAEKALGEAETSLARITDKESRDMLDADLRQLASQR